MRQTDAKGIQEYTCRGRIGDSQGIMQEIKMRCIRSRRPSLVLVNKKKRKQRDYLSQTLEGNKRKQKDNKYLDLSREKSVKEKCDSGNNCCQYLWNSPQRLEKKQKILEIIQTTMLLKSVRKLKSPDDPNGLAVTQSPVKNQLKVV